jgi:hypothetical protein
MSGLRQNNHDINGAPQADAELTIFYLWYWSVPAGFFNDLDILFFIPDQLKIKL